MSPSQRRNALAREIEQIFEECREELENAIRDYEQEVRSAIEELKQDATAPSLIH